MVATIYKQLQIKQASYSHYMNVALTFRCYSW